MWDGYNSSYVSFYLVEYNYQIIFPDIYDAIEAEYYNT